MADKTVKVHVSNLKKSFGKLEVLKDISIDIHEGEVVVLLGPSGSGKSTFLRCLNQLEIATEGEIIVDGNNVTDKHTDINKVRENIGMVFQHFNLFPHKTVLENIMLAPVELKKMTKEQAKEKGLQLLKRVGMFDKADVYPNMLSGGQKQRVSIARCFLKNPPILILDEATSALDTATEIKIQHSFDALSKGRTTLIIAHRLSKIQNADCIAVVGEKEILETGTHAELLAKNGAYAKLYAPL